MQTKRPDSGLIPESGHFLEISDVLGHCLLPEVFLGLFIAMPRIVVEHVNCYSLAPYLTLIADNQ